MHFRSLSLFALALGQAALAQNTIPAENLPATGDLHPIRWTVGDDGRTWMSPAPHAGDDEGTEPLFGEIGDETSFVDDFMMNSGAMGWGMLFCAGPGDLLSLTDARKHFELLGYPTDAVALSQRIAAVADGDNEALRHRAHLDRILAIRIAQRDRLTPLTEQLASIAADRDEDRFVRRAAAEAHADLLGRPRPAWEQPLEPIADILAAMPADIEQLGVVQFDAMPDPRELPVVAREIGIEVTRREIQSAGGSVSPAQLAGAMRLALIPGEAPFEFSRVFGLQNPRRIVSGFRETGQDVGLTVAEGMFSPEPLFRALAAAGGIEATFENGTLRATLPENATLTVTETRAELRIGTFEPGGEAVAASLGDARPSPADGYWLWLRDVTELPLDQIPLELPIFEKLEGSLTARLLSGPAIAELTVHYDSEEAAKVAANGIRQVPGLALTALGAESDIPMDLIQDLLRGFSAKNAGKRVTVRLEHELPFPELLVEIARAAVEARR